jgi:hypothetical protein
MDDDALERALAALPLEEPPERLHARIMNATVYAPAVRLASSPLHTWEITAIGIVAAVAVWLSWLVLTVPGAVDRARVMVDAAISAAQLNSVTTLVWIAVGLSAAFWISTITVPQGRVRAQ